MNHEEIKKELAEHKNRIKKLTYTNKLLGEILISDQKFIKYSEKNNINYLYIKYILKEIKEKHFILSQEQFLSFISQPDYESELKELWELLIGLKFIRIVQNDEYLISELFNYYVDLCDNYSLDSIEYSDKYSHIDEMNVADALDLYHKFHKKDPMFSTEAYCEYYGYEFDDTFTFG